MHCKPQIKITDVFKYEDIKYDCCVQFILDLIADNCTSIQFFEKVLFYADIEGLKLIDRVITGADYFVKEGELFADKENKIGAFLIDYMKHLTSVECDIIIEVFEKELRGELPELKLKDGYVLLQELTEKDVKKL